MSKEGGEMVWLILDFQDSFFFFCLLRPMYGWITRCSKKRGLFFSPPQNSNVAGSAKWAQIRKIANYSIIRKTNLIFSLAIATWHTSPLFKTIRIMSISTKYYGTTCPNSPLCVHIGIVWTWWVALSETVCSNSGHVRFWTARQTT